MCLDAVGFLPVLCALFPELDDAYLSHQSNRKTVARDVGLTKRTQRKFVSTHARFYAQYGVPHGS